MGKIRHRIWLGCGGELGDGTETIPGPGEHDQLKPEERLAAQSPGFQPWLCHYKLGDLGPVASPV